MSINTGLKVLAGAVALAVSGGAFAATTNASTTGTIFLLEYDQTNNTEFVYDTGLSAASFAGTSSLPTISLATDPNYLAFVAGESASTDTVVYSVLAGYTSSTNTKFNGTLFTATGTPAAQSGITIADSTTQIGSVLSQINNPAGGTTYEGSSAPVSALWESGYESKFTGDLNITSDYAALGTALAFYSTSTVAPKSATAPGTLSTFAGTWDFVSGVLTYTVQSSTVPLPTPVLLLLSGLGMMGLVTRRRQNGTAA
jgi:hypothetical protein